MEGEDFVDEGAGVAASLLGVFECLAGGVGAEGGVVVGGLSGVVGGHGWPGTLSLF